MGRFPGLRPHRDGGRLFSLPDRALSMARPRTAVPKKGLTPERRKRRGRAAAHVRVPAGVRPTVARRLHLSLSAFARLPLSSGLALAPLDSWRLPAGGAGLRRQAVAAAGRILRDPRPCVVALSFGSLPCLPGQQRTRCPGLSREARPRRAGQTAQRRRPPG